MIRVRGGQGYELLATGSDDESIPGRLGVEGVLNRRSNEAETSLSAPSVGAETAASPRGVRPRHRKSSRQDEGGEETSLLPGSKNGLDVELSQKMLGPSNKSKKAPSEPPEFLEVAVKAGDTLQGLALRFGCPVAELKRLNNVYSDQEIHSLRRLKVPAKKHGLLAELLADDENERQQRRKRRRGGKTPRRLLDDNDGEDGNAGRSTPEANGAASAASRWMDAAPSSEDPSLKDPGSSTGSLARESSSINPIKELENLFPNRDLTDCESDSRRGSCSESDSAPTTPLVRTFYLSIRDNFAAPADSTLSSSSTAANSRTSPDGSRAARGFLSKMDADLERIRSSHSSAKGSLDEVAATLASKRFRPLNNAAASTAASSSSAASNGATGDAHGTLLGMNWWTLLLGAVLLFALMLFTFYTYARRQENNNAAGEGSHGTVDPSAQEGR